MGGRPRGSHPVGSNRLPSPGLILFGVAWLGLCLVAVWLAGSAPALVLFAVGALPLLGRRLGGAVPLARALGLLGGAIGVWSALDAVRAVGATAPYAERIPLAWLALPARRRSWRWQGSPAPS